LGRVLVALFFVALGIAALHDVARIGRDLPWHVTYDFPDFYCAGAVLDARANPYTYEPLRTCEHRVNRVASFQANPSIAIPAPQPPYDFPAFMALARLNFAHARAIYAASIVVAVLLTALILWRLEIPLDVALLALALSAGYNELAAGQIVPFGLLLLVASGWMLARRYDIFAGTFVAMTLVEPHLGAGVVLAVLLFVPRARLSLIATVFLLALLGFTVAGPAAFVTYVARVLPAQAAAEVSFPAQYSLTYALHTLGVADSTALAAGALSFGAFALAGILLAPRLAARLQRRELLVFFPAATAVIGGAYVHVIELCFAIPAALVLAMRAPGIWRGVAAAALAILTVPWIIAWSVKKLFLASIFVVVALLYRLRVQRTIGIATAVLVAGALYFFELHPPKLPTPPFLAAGAYPSNALVQTEWHAVVQALALHDPLWLAIKLPAWCALAAILLTGIALRGLSEDRVA
jgi:hypothetical protein